MSAEPYSRLGHRRWRSCLRCSSRLQVRHTSPWRCDDTLGISSARCSTLTQLSARPGNRRLTHTDVAGHNRRGQPTAGRSSTLHHTGRLRETSQACTRQRTTRSDRLDSCHCSHRGQSPELGSPEQTQLLLEVLQLQCRHSIRRPKRCSRHTAHHRMSHEEHHTLLHNHRHQSCAGCSSYSRQRSCLRHRRHRPLYTELLSTLSHHMTVPLLPARNNIYVIKWS